MRGRPAIIVSAENSQWVSCRSITANLASAYVKAFQGEVNFFPLDFASSWAIPLYARQIARTQPNRLVILDHKPHPGLLLLELAKVYGKKPIPPIYVHVYGDFTLYSHEWLMTAQALRKCKLVFVCASDRQKKLISRFVRRAGASAVHLCPFPVDSTFFTFDPGLRQKAREKLRADPEERICFYSGRISYQKNVIELARCFLRATEKLAVPSRLVIAGQFDDIGSPFTGIFTLRGEYFQRWNSFLRSLSEDERSRIQYLGYLDQEQLRDVYHASDVAVSLSMHHDEDYGMSPAEALMTGSRAVLSDWGGYASFKDPHGFCRTIGTHINGKKSPIALGDFERALRKQIQVPIKDKERQRIREHFMKRFSIEAASEIISKIHRKPAKRFVGFNQRMAEHAERLQQYRKGYALFPEGMRPKTFYEDVYRPYYGRSTRG